MIFAGNGKIYVAWFPGFSGLSPQEMGRQNILYPYTALRFPEIKLL
jgi:hypothetical protein